MVAFDELIKNYSCFNVNNQSCLYGLFFSSLVVFGCFNLLFIFKKSSRLDADHTGGGITGTKKPSRGGLGVIFLISLLESLTIVAF